MTYRGHPVSIPAEKIRSKVMLNAQLLTINARDAKQLDEWCNESSSSFLCFAGWGCVWSQPKRCRWLLGENSCKCSGVNWSRVFWFAPLSTGWCWFRESRSSFDREVRWLSQHCLLLRLSRSQRMELAKDVNGQKCQGNFTNSILPCMAVPLERLLAILQVKFPSTLGRLSRNGAVNLFGRRFHCT